MPTVSLIFFTLSRRDVKNKFFVFKFLRTLKKVPWNREASAPFGKTPNIGARPRAKNLAALILNGLVLD
jgi:hypothetical protein